MNLRPCVLFVSGAMFVMGSVGCYQGADESLMDGAEARCWGWFGDDDDDEEEDDGVCEAKYPYSVYRVRKLLDAQGIEPIPAPPEVPTEQVELGRALFFDKILSGTKDVACATCHHPALGSADGRPLFAGINGEGIGLARDGELGGRHSQHIFNLHLNKDLTIDGKVEFRDGQYLALGLPLIPQAIQDQFLYGVYSAQAIMPIVTPNEMVGYPGDNELADCPAGDLTCIWDGVMARLGAIPEYVALFEAAYPGVDFDDMTIAHVGNAIAAFELETFYYANSPFDRFLAGDDCALSYEELQGAERFYNKYKGNCASCHSGGAMTDQEYHKTATPQFGPGKSIPKGDGLDERDDFGRMRNTGDPADKYAWRTPALRNVDLTAPYGRLGQYSELEDMVAHYRDVEVSLVEYDAKQLALPELWGTLLDNADDVLANGIDPLLGKVYIGKQQHVDELVAFMHALTDPATANLTDAIPATVPSGLPVDLGE